MLWEGEAEILTLAAGLGFTVMITSFEMAGDPVAQLASEVITQLTTSLLAIVVDVNEGPLPEEPPLTVHW
jgi:hypothetical protein